MEAVICGIDPGLLVPGYAVLRGPSSLVECDPHDRPHEGPQDDPSRFLPVSPATVIDAGVCRFRGKDSLETRLAQLECDVASVLKEHHPSVLAVEQLYAHYKHPRTAILMGHARGVILLAGVRAGLEIRSYAATQIKRHLTGNGRASKSQMQRAIQSSLGLANLPEPADVADAMAIALCGLSDNARQTAAGVPV